MPDDEVFTPHPEDGSSFSTPESIDRLRRYYREHSRKFKAYSYVYPVVSRRSRGVSIGVNLSLGRECNYRCIYCQVDRREAEPAESLDLDRLRVELETLVAMAADGRLFETPEFRHVPIAMRTFRDIALSGDGEPTLSRCFPDVAKIAADVRRRLAPESVKLVLITNATLLDRPRVRETLRRLDNENGEIWAKLDAGTQAYHKRVLRTDVPLDRVVANISAAAAERPIVIQSLFLAVHGEPVSDEEIGAYIARLQEIQASGGAVKCVQIHTVARTPAESWATPLPNAKIDAIAAKVRAATGLNVEAFDSG